MQIRRTRLYTLFALALLIMTLRAHISMNGLTNAQSSSDLLNLHGPSLEPIHLNSNITLKPVHMHSQEGLLYTPDLEWPWFNNTEWHELYPNFCDMWYLSSWEDHGDPFGLLSADDQIDLTNLDTGETVWFHVDRLTITLLLSGPYPDYYHEAAPPTMAIELKMPALWYDPYFVDDPAFFMGSWWHEVWGNYSNIYQLTSWQDNPFNPDGSLSWCDSIDLTDNTGLVTYWHVEDVATDIILRWKMMDPISTWWHEIHPNFCNWHHLTSWEEPIEDLWPNRLGPGDQIDMIEETTLERNWYFVDRLTITINVTKVDWETKEPFPREWMKIELKTWWDGLDYMYHFLKEPLYSIWHEAYPNYCNHYNLTWWDPLDPYFDNCNCVLDPCDYIVLLNQTNGLENLYHITDMTYDLILNKKITDPVCTDWYVLYPGQEYGDAYHVEGWSDNSDGLLSPCDNITLAPPTGGPAEEYHVENMTITVKLMNMTQEPSIIYIEAKNTFEWLYWPKIDPYGCTWKLKYPFYGETEYIAEIWEDNCNGVLDYCDNLTLWDMIYQGYSKWHVEDVAIDMWVKWIAPQVHDVAVTAVVPQFASRPQGWPCPIVVTVQNEGDFTETFDVDVKYNGTHVTTSPVTVSNLPAHTSKSLTFCWVTKNVPLGPYTISAYAHPVPGETDLADNTLVDGTVTIQAPSPPGFYWKEGFCDYAPSGMPDFDQRQDAWQNPPPTWTWCSPTAAANSIWWFDSKYEPAQPPILPPAISDGYPLVSSYNPGVWDDHDPQNVQPFIQHLAYLMDTDGQRTHLPHQGTFVTDMETGIAQYLSWTGVNPLGDCNGDGIVNNTDLNIVNAAMGSAPGGAGWDMRADIAPVTQGWPNWGPADNLITLADAALVAANINKTGTFYEHTVNQPEFYYVEEEVERSQDVVLSIGFWYWNGEFWEYREELGHSVTVAGVNSEALKIGISDPMWDAFENGLIPEGRVPIPHAHGPEPPYITHNDAALVSHDIYDVILLGMPGPGSWILHNYPGVPGDPVPWPIPGWYAVVEDAVITSPLAAHDVAVTDIFTVYDGFRPPEYSKTLVCQGYTTHINVTVENHGDATENVNVALWAQNISTYQVDATVPVTLNPGASQNITFLFNATSLPKANYTIFANVTVVPGETNIADNTLIDGKIAVVYVGNVVVDGIVDISDISAIARAFGAVIPDPKYNANLDINDDGIVDISDIAIAARHYGESTDP